MLMQDYTVRLDNFQGPLDLLLYLIRRVELDVSAISLAEITDQYLRFLDGISHVDIDEAGEFLVIAATLIELKSRLVAPAPVSEDGTPSEGGVSDLAKLQAAAMDEADNPAAELVRQLLAYKAYRDAADALEERRERWENQFPAGRAGTPTPVLVESDDPTVEELELFDLVEAFARIIETVNFDRIGEHEVVDDDTPIELHAQDIVDRIRRDAPQEGAISFRSIFSGRTRSEMVGLFIALLELTRQRRIRVMQERTSDDIMIRLIDPATEPEPILEEEPGAAGNEEPEPVKAKVRKVRKAQSAPAPVSSVGEGTNPSDLGSA